jgi:predicted metal-dependent HD superfamily phosphohydrolase
MNESQQASQESSDVESRIRASWMASNQDFSLPLSDKRLEALHTHWNAATRCFSNQDAVHQWWERIRNLHSEVERAYHSLVHLEELFGFLAILDIHSNHKDYTVLALSIFFHDAIYNPKSGTNEEDSVKLFQCFFREAGDCTYEGLEALICEYILATKQHKAPDDGGSCLGLFLDIDMAVLGKESSAYHVYAGLVRQEYGFVERSVYCEKRAEVLETFLKNETIFCTPVMKTVLEERARENLRAEIELLKTGTIPGESSPRLST